MPATRPKVSPVTSTLDCQKGKASLPGLALPKATTSATDLNGLSAGTTRSHGDRPIVATGTRSFSWS